MVWYDIVFLIDSISLRSDGEKGRLRLGVLFYILVQHILCFWTGPVPLAWGFEVLILLEVLLY